MKIKKQNELVIGLRIEFHDTDPFGDDDESREITRISHSTGKLSDSRAYWLFSYAYDRIANELVRHWHISITADFGEYRETVECRCKCRFRDLDDAAGDAVLRAYQSGNPNHFRRINFVATCVRLFKTEDYEIIEY